MLNVKILGVEMPEFDYIKSFDGIYTVGYLGSVCIAVLEKNQYQKLTSSETFC